MLLFTLLWSLLFVVPGIIAAYRYSMAPFIMAENPDIGIREAVRRSKMIMHGNKLRLFRLQLSFFGWYLLTALSLLPGRGGAPEEPSRPQLTGNAERVAYLQEMGWQVEEEPVTTLQFLLPPQLKGDYVAYNALQKSQGFDLEPCCGKQVTRYTYTVTNYPQRPDGVQLNLYVCEDLPVAGDVVCTGADGFQNTLVFPGEAGESFR